MDNPVDHSQRAHSRFGGSVIGRIIACPGSVALCDGVPDSPSSYAREGTQAHTLAEYCLRNGHWSAADGAEASCYYDAKGDPWEYPADMLESVQTYLDVVYEEMHRDKDDAELFVEQRFTLDIASADPGEVFGANDAMVYHPSTGRLAVFDYKHGAGVSVSVEDSPQLKFYGVGAVFSSSWTISEVELVIVQPRARDAESTDGVKRWQMETTELFEFLGEIDQAVARAKDVMAGMAVTGQPRFMDEPLDNPSKALQTGSQCRFCRAAPICPARQAEILELAQLDVTSLTEITVDHLPEPKDFDVARLAAMVKGGELLAAWLNQAYALLEGRLRAGDAVPGYKLVYKQAQAKWAASEEEIAGYLALLYGLEEDALRPRTLVTITEAEKQLKAVAKGEAFTAAKDDLRLRFTVKEPSGTTMVPDSDKREAVSAAADAVTGLTIITA